MNQAYTIYLGDETQVLSQTLSHLTKQSTSLHINFCKPGHFTKTEKSVIQGNLVKIASEHGYFENNPILNVNWILETELEEHLKNSVFIPLPDSIEKEEQDSILVFSDERLDLLNDLGEKGHSLNEDILETIIALPPLNNWMNLDNWRNRIFKALTQLLNSPPNERHELLAHFHILQNNEIWKYGLHQEWRKELQEPALQRLMADPQDIPAHLVLSIFKRYYEGDIPESISEVLQGWKNTQGDYIQIMPPLENLAVTYLLTTYNRLEFFKRAAKHIMKQSNTSWHISILDHGSNIETQEYCQRLKKQHPDKIKIYRKDENTGVNAIFGHLQELIETAPTELICFCSDDDYYLSNHLQESLDLFQKHPWLGMVYGGKRLVNSKGETQAEVGPYYKESQIVDPHVELQRIIPMRSASPHFIIRRSVLKNIGDSDPCVPKGSNYGCLDTVCHIFAVALSEVACVNKILSVVSFDPQSAFMQVDINSIWLVMAGDVVKKYKGLFDSPLPIKPVQQLLETLFGLSAQKLWGELNHLEDPKVYYDNLEIKNTFYKEAFEFKQNIMSQCDDQTPFLFETQHPYTPI